MLDQGVVEECFDVLEPSSPPSRIVDGRRYHESFEQRRRNEPSRGSKREVRVGDLVGVDVEDFGWAGAEVCDIWWEDDESWATVRWLYSYDDLPKQCRRELDSDELVETETFDDVPSESIVGTIRAEVRYLYKAQSKSLVKVSRETRKRRCAQILRGAKRKKRLSGGGDDEKTDLERCISSLQLRNTPENLPRREKERKQVERFLRKASSDGGRMYISGMPGTGKTATVHEVVRSLGDDDDGNAFDFLEINAMRLPRPSHAYVLLWQKISGGDLKSPEVAARLLDEAFCRDQQQENKMLVVLVDELDYMMTKDQTVLYNFFDWPGRSKKLTVVGIANTMDLPERLEPKVRSRLGPERLVFHPYTVQDVQAILEDRLGDLVDVVFDKKAMEMAARKVAAYSGDVRRALQICATAAELCQNRGAEKVAIEDVKQAVVSISGNSASLAAVRDANETQRLVLAAICSSENEEDEDNLLDFEQLTTRIGRVQPKVPELDRLLHALAALHDARLLTLQFIDSRHRFPHIHLNVDARLVKDTLLSLKK